MSCSSIDANTFVTTEVHPEDQPELQRENNKAFIVSANFPGFPIGLTWLNFDRCADVHIKASAEPMEQDSFNVHLNGSEDTLIHSAGCTWLTIYAKDRDFQFGNFSTKGHRPDEPRLQTKCKVEFRKPFQGQPPKVIVWFNELHMSSQNNWRCKAFVTNITTDAFIIHIETWATTTLYDAAVSWIAYPSNRPNIASGSFNTMDVRPWFFPRTNTKGVAKFDKPFGSTPRVLAALNWLDMGNWNDLRLKLTISDVNSKGLTWHLDTWDSSILYSAGASYIAISDM